MQLVLPSTKILNCWHCRLLTKPDHSKLKQPSHPCINSQPTRTLHTLYCNCSLLVPRALGKFYLLSNRLLFSDATGCPKRNYSSSQILSDLKTHLVIFRGAENLRQLDIVNVAIKNSSGKHQLPCNSMVLVKYEVQALTQSSLCFIHFRELWNGLDWKGP